MLIIFPCIRHLYLWRNVCIGLLPTFLLGCLILSCMSCLWILDSNPLTVVLFAIIFSHSKHCLFTSFIVSFAVRKFLIRSHLFILVVIPITLGGGSKRILLWFRSYSVLLMFSSKSFIVSGLIFRSLIHFIFVYGVKEDFILLHVTVQFSQHHLLKRLSFPHCIFLPLLSKRRCPWVYGFIWAFYLVPLVYISVSVPLPYCLDDILV